MFGRKQRRTHRQQLMDELAESYGHLKLAAGHLSGGASESVAPTYARARDAANRGWVTTRGAFVPLYEQMRDGAANARREFDVPSTKKSRWPVLVGLLAAGAAVGAAGAVVARRRRAAAEWDEYDPMPAVTSRYGSDSSGDSKVSSAANKVSHGAASMADSVSAQASKLADSLHDRSHRDPNRPTGLPGMAEPADPSDKPKP